MPTVIRHAELTWAPGYCFGSDGTVWTRKQRGGAHGRGIFCFEPNWRRKKLHLHGRREEQLQVSIVTIDDGMKFFLVHRLVLEAFLGPAPEGLEGCHNDGNTLNNWLDNLRWDTHENNELDKIRHGTIAQGDEHYSRRCPELVLRGEKNLASKLTEEDVVYLRRAIRSGKYYGQVAKELGLATQTVFLAAKGRTWAHVAEPFVE